MPALPGRKPGGQYLLRKFYAYPCQHSALSGVYHFCAAANDFTVTKPSSGFSAHLYPIKANLQGMWKTA